MVVGELPIETQMTTVVGLQFTEASFHPPDYSVCVYTPIPLYPHLH
jgi:hypothetical protein